MQRKNFFEKISIFVSFWSLEGCGKGVRGDTSPHCYLTIEYAHIDSFLRKQMPLLQRHNNAQRLQRLQNAAPGFGGGMVREEREPSAGYD